VRLSKRFSHDRPGLQLLGIEKGAVPVTVVAVDILAQEIKELPLLDEFVLRLIKAEVGGVPEIAAFLGLDAKLVEVTVTDHYREGAVLAGPLPGQLLLSERGKRLADDLESIRPVRKTVKLAFDRLTWSLADYDTRDLVRKEVAQSDGRILLPAQRTTRIKTTDITADAVNSFLRRPARGAAVDVLDVIDVTPSTHRYMPADVLVFGDADRAEAETAIIIDGDPSPNHDSVLSTLGATDKLGISIEPATPHPPLPTHLRKDTATPAPGTLIGANLPSTREIQLFDHLNLLAAALDNTSRRLLIATDVATSSVVDVDLIEKLETRLRAGVRVDLIISRCDRVADDRLTTLARRSRGRLHIHRVDRVDRNTLVFDGQWVVSDFPWLSFSGAGRPFRDYTGTVVMVPEEVENVYTTLRSLLAN
jgi:hypothetical protein